MGLTKYFNMIIVILHEVRFYFYYVNIDILICFFSICHLILFLLFFVCYWVILHYFFFGLCNYFWGINQIWLKTWFWLQKYTQTWIKCKSNAKALWNYSQPLVTKQKNRTHFYEYIPAKSSESSEILSSLLDDVHGSRLV